MFLIKMIGEAVQYFMAKGVILASLSAASNPIPINSPKLQHQLLRKARKSMAEWLKTNIPAIMNISYICQ